MLLALKLLAPQKNLAWRWPKILKAVLAAKLLWPLLFLFDPDYESARAALKESAGHRTRPGVFAFL